MIQHPQVQMSQLQAAGCVCHIVLRHCSRSAPSDCFCGVSEDRCLAHPHVCLLHTLSVFLWRISRAIDERWHRLFVTCLGILISTKGFCAERVAGAAWSISIWTVVCVFVCFCSCVFILYIGSFDFQSHDNEKFDCVFWTTVSCSPLILAVQEDKTGHTVPLLWILIF